MNIDSYVGSIADALVAAGELGDDQTRRTAAAFASAVAAPARLAVLRALSDMAAEVSQELGDRIVTVRLDGSDVVLDVRDVAAAEPEGAPPTFEDVTGDISRVTLRLVEQIKARAEEAAAQSGVSLNSWVSQAVQGALREQMRYQRRAQEYRRRADDSPHRTEDRGAASPSDESGAGPSTTPQPPAAPEPPERDDR